MKYYNFCESIQFCFLRGTSWVLVTFNFDIKQVFVLSFAFLRHYCFWLTGPAFVGGCMFVAQIANGSLILPGMIIPVIMLCFWSVLFSTFWKRKQSLLRAKWGMEKYADKEVKRPQFEGSWSVSSVTGEVIINERKTFRFLKNSPHQFDFFTINFDCRESHHSSFFLFCFSQNDDKFILA